MPFEASNRKGKAAEIVGSLRRTEKLANPGQLAQSLGGHFSTITYRYPGVKGRIPELMARIQDTKPESFKAVIGSIKTIEVADAARKTRENETSATLESMRDNGVNASELDEAMKLTGRAKEKALDQLARNSFSGFSAFKERFNGLFRGGVEARFGYTLARQEIIGSMKEIYNSRELVRAELAQAKEESSNLLTVLMNEDPEMQRALRNAALGLKDGTGEEARQKEQSNSYAPVLDLIANNRVTMGGPEATGSDDILAAIMQILVMILQLRGRRALAANDNYLAYSQRGSTAKA